MQTNSDIPALPATQQNNALAYPQGVPMGMPYPEESDGGEGLTIGGLLHSLRRQLLPAVGLGILIATLMAAMLWFLIPVTYRAQAVLRISRELSEGTSGDYMIYKETQGSLLKSNFVITAALRDNDVNQLPMVVNDRFGRKRKPGADVAWLTDAIDVNFAGDSELIFAGLSGRDREDTETILDAVVDSYQKEIVNKERLDKVDTLTKLRKRYAQLFDSIKKKTDEVRKLAKQLGSPDSRAVAQQQAMKIGQMNHAQQEADRLWLQYNEAMDTYRLMALEAQLGSGTPSEFRIEDELEKDPQYYNLRLEIDALKDEVERISGFVKSNSSQLIGYQQEIARLERKRAGIREQMTPRIIARIKAQSGRLSPADQRTQLLLQQQQLNNLAGRLKRAQEKYKEKLAEVESMGFGSGELEARADDLMALRRDMSSVRADMAKLEIELDGPERIQIIQEATVLKDSNLKAKIFQIAGGWLISLCGVIVAVSYWDFLGKRVNSSKDLTRSVRVIGSLPSIQQTGVISFSKIGRDEIEEAMKVAIDAIRTAILYNRQHPAQTVIITSATGQEGRSTVASQLAVSLARSGKTTLLIDGDLRNPQQHAVFDVPTHGGLSEMLRGEQTSDEAIVATSVENVWLLSAGRCDQNALQGLSGDQAKNIFQDFRERFDMIIIDASPVLTSADSLLLGQHADAALLSVRRDVSQMPKVNAASDRLMSVGIPILGAVVNGDDIELRSGETQVAVPEAEQPALTNA